jgi:hypothetical protein
VYTQQPVYNAPPTNQNADTGMSGLAIFFIVILVLGVIATILYFVFRTSTAEAYSTTTDTTYGPTPTSYSGGGGSGRRYAAAPSTVVIHDSPRYDSSGNLITGMLIGEALSRNNQPQQVYVNPPAVYTEPQPSYQPDYSTPAAAPVADAPDSSWGETTQQADAPDTNFEAPTESAPSYEAPAETPSFDAPSTDFGSSNDQSF